MLELNLIRENPEIVRKSLSDRQMDPAQVDQVLSLDGERRTLLTEVEKLKAERNVVSKEISQTKDAVARQQKINAMRKVGDRISAIDEKVKEVDEKLRYLMLSIPNLPDPTTPYGKDDSENVVLRTVGELPEFDFKPLAHW